MFPLSKRNKAAVIMAPILPKKVKVTIHIMSILSFYLLFKLPIFFSDISLIYGEKITF